jgi:gluconolactonase
MRLKATFVFALCLMCSLAVFAQDGGGQGGGQGRGQGGGQGRGQGGGRGGAGGGGGQAQDAVPKMDKTVASDVPGVVKAGTKMEIIKYGIRGSDAGVGMPDGSVLIAGNGGVLKVAEDGTLTTLVENSDQAAGLTMDSKGNIYGAQYSKKVSLLYPKENAATLTDSYDGKPYIRPNDLVVDKKGGIYFTDCYQVGAKKSPDDLPQGVYYIAPGPAPRKVTRVIDNINRPNGIILSPNEKKLYVNDWDGSYLVSYDVNSDGTLKNKTNFGMYTLKQETDHGMVSGADGLCIDNKSNLFSTTPAGVQVFNSKGEHLADIEAPYDMPPQNCGFGGAGKMYLYVVGRGVVYRIKTENPGPKDRAK